LNFNIIVCTILFLQIVIIDNQNVCSTRIVLQHLFFIIFSFVEQFSQSFQMIRMNCFFNFDVKICQNIVFSNEMRIMNQIVHFENIEKSFFLKKTQCFFDNIKNIQIMLNVIHDCFDMRMILNYYRHIDYHFNAKQHFELCFFQKKNHDKYHLTYIVFKFFFLSFFCVIIRFSNNKIFVWWNTRSCLIQLFRCFDLNSNQFFFSFALFFFWKFSSWRLKFEIFNFLRTNRSFFLSFDVKNLKTFFDTR
jgi:hypothetical protein